MTRRLAAASLALLLLAACGSDADDDARAEPRPARETTTTSVDEDAPPQPGDHVHLAYGIYLCDHWLEPLVDAGEDETGIHTHGDGLIHVHPFAPDVTGDRAVLDVWAQDVDLVLGDGELELPDGTHVSDGDDCDGRRGELRAQVWDDPGDPEPEVVTDHLGDIPVARDGGVIAIVFAPEDTEVELPRWAGNLEQPTLTEQGKDPLVA